LGACLGDCPQGAISIIEREAEAFDEAAVQQHLAQTDQAPSPTANDAPAAPVGCPGAMPQELQLNVLSASPQPPQPQTAAGTSGLRNWPVQLHLVPPNAPFLQNADLLLAADCVPFAMRDFHDRFLKNRPVVIGCPKLDNVESYVDKLFQIFTVANVRSVTVLHMEVPCCTGLVRLAQRARELSGGQFPLEDVTISLQGRIVDP
jgi:hypothetical protein